MDLPIFPSMSCVMCLKGNFGLFGSFQKVKMLSRTVNQHLQVNVNTLIKLLFANFKIMVFQAFILCELFHCCDFGGSSNNNLARLPTKAHKSRLVICMINCGVMRCTVIPKGDFSEEYNFYILISIFKSSGNNVHKLTPT